MRPNADQEAFWSDRVGAIWVSQARAMDAALAPVLDAVLSSADIKLDEAVLDIGCGAGNSTRAAARRVGPDGSVWGVDISTPLLGAAQAQQGTPANANYLRADAQTHSFETGTFNCLISRFGVMFFEDPTAAFANMAQALCPGGRMCFATWGASADNPFFTLPAFVAKSTLGPVPKSDPDAPGPFSMRDCAAVTKILENVGLQKIHAADLSLNLTPDGDAYQIAKLMCQIGPAHGALAYHGADDTARERLADAIATALAPYETPKGIRIPARINLFTAIKP